MVMVGNRMVGKDYVGLGIRKNEMAKSTCEVNTDEQWYINNATRSEEDVNKDKLSVEDIASMMCANCQRMITQDSKPMTFEDFAQDMDIKSLHFSKEELATLKVHFDKAIKLESSEKFKEADKVWNDMFSMIDDKQIKQAFDHFAREMNVDKLSLNDDEKKSVEASFVKAHKLLLDGKMEEANSEWASMTKLLKSKDPTIEIGNLMDNYMTTQEIQALNFQNFKEDIKMNALTLTKEEKEEKEDIEALFKESDQLFLEGKIEEADDKWQQMLKIIERNNKDFLQ